LLAKYFLIGMGPGSKSTHVVVLFYLSIYDMYIKIAKSRTIKLFSSGVGSTEYVGDKSARAKQLTSGLWSATPRQSTKKGDQ
jgi:hypothetical protein